MAYLKTIAVMFVIGLLIFGCAAAPPRNQTNQTPPPVPQPQPPPQAMSCGAYCDRQPHETCPAPGTGAWNVSGVYPDCKCRYDCTNITQNYSNMTGNYSGVVSMDINLRSNKFSPESIAVNSSQLVNLTIRNNDAARHTFTLPAYGIDVQIPPGAVSSVVFVAYKAGQFGYECTLHPGMDGMLSVANVTGNVTGNGTNVTGNATGNISINVTAVDGDFMPGQVNVPLNAQVWITVHNAGTVAHTFTIPSYGIDVQLPVNATEQVSFLANKPGTHPIQCTLHPGMDGSLVVTTSGGNTTGNTTGNTSGGMYGGGGY